MTTRRIQRSLFLGGGLVLSVVAATGLGAIVALMTAAAQAAG